MLAARLAAWNSGKRSRLVRCVCFLKYTHSDIIYLDVYIIILKIFIIGMCDTEESFECEGEPVNYPLKVESTRGEWAFVWTLTHAPNCTRDFWCFSPHFSHSSWQCFILYFCLWPDCFCASLHFWSTWGHQGETRSSFANIEIITSKPRVCMCVGCFYVTLTTEGILFVHPETKKACAPKSGPPEKHRERKK